jgi:hypothetical protein
MSFILAEDAALKDLLKGMTVSDVNSEERTVEVFYSIPDVEVRAQKYPYVTIDLIDIRPANDRQQAGYLTDEDLNGTKTPEEGVFYRYYLPVAYDLVYQVSTWSRHPYHDRTILQQMLSSRFPSKYGKLEVPNNLGTDSVNRSMFLDEFTKMSFVEDGRRLFRNVFTVRVVSEITPVQADLVSAQLVEKVNINKQTTYIPSTQYPV